MAAIKMNHYIQRVLVSHHTEHMSAKMHSSAPNFDDILNC